MSTFDFIAYLLSCNHLTVFPFVGNVLSFLSWNVHFKWSEKEFLQCLVRGRTSPSQDISSNPPPKDTPRMHCLPPPGKRLTSNHLIGFSGTISKGISREWEFDKIECYHVSDDKKKTVFLVSLHFALNSVCILYVVCILNPVCSMQYEFFTDRFPNTWTPKMANITR